MHEYIPKSEKRLEKILCAGLLVLAVLFFAGSKLPNMPYPVIWQAISFCLLGFLIIVLSKFLITSYSYRIDEAGELIITQICSKRLTVVCRIPVSAVTEGNTLTAENKGQLLAARKKKMIYRYTGEIRTVGAMLLDVSYGGEDFCLIVLTDSEMQKRLSHRYSNF